MMPISFRRLSQNCLGKQTLSPQRDQSASIEMPGMNTPKTHAAILATELLPYQVRFAWLDSGRAQTTIVFLRPAALSVGIKRLLLHALQRLEHRDPALPAAVDVAFGFAGGHHRGVVGGAGEGLQDAQPAFDVGRALPGFL